MPALKTGVSPSGNPTFAVSDARDKNGESVPIVLDLRQVLPDIQKRRPTIFAGYDGNKRDDRDRGAEYSAGEKPSLKRIDSGSAPAYPDWMPKRRTASASDAPIAVRDITPSRVVSQ